MLLRAVITMQENGTLDGRCLPPFFFFFAKFSGKWLTATRTMEVYRFNNEIYRVDDCVDSCECTFFFFNHDKVRCYCAFRMELLEKD